MRSKQLWLTTSLLAVIVITTVLNNISVTATTPPRPITAAEARQRIEAHRALIDKRFKEMDTLFYAGNAVATLKAAFQKNNVSDRRETQNWGMNGLSSGWLDAKTFYNIHDKALRDSLTVIGRLATVKDSDLAYLDQSMKAWQTQEAELQRLFQEAVAVYTRYAINADKQDAIYADIEKRRTAAKERSLAEWQRVYEATKLEATERLKPVELEKKQIDEAYNKVWQNIKELSKKQLFTAINLSADEATSAGSLKADKDKYKSDEPIVVTFNNLPGNAKDWITIVKATAKADTYGEYYYTAGQQQGKQSFAALPEGKYEARLYYNWSAGGYTVQARYAFVVADPKEWRVIALETERYGLNDLENGKILKAVEKAAQKFLNKVDPKAGKLAENLPKVFSINQAVDVFITYACVNQVTDTILNTQVIKLDDKDSVHWWAEDAKGFGKRAMQDNRERVIKVRKPQVGCP